jgi:hypothetical protein
MGVEKVLLFSEIAQVGDATPSERSDGASAPV